MPWLDSSMEIPVSVRRLNERLGHALGKNPHDEPLYKWVHSEDFWHWMMDQNGFEEVTQPSGLITMAPTYTRRKMCPQFTDTWIIAHWQPPEPEGMWRRMYGPSVLWPRMGIYTPANAWAERGQLPCDGLTDRFIEIVSRHRAKTRADIRQEGEDIVEYEEREASRLRKDIIDDAMTAHLAIPGSRAGSVSFPMPGVDYSVPLTPST